MKQDRELKMQLLKEFEHLDNPIDFCRKAYEFLMEGEEKLAINAAAKTTDGVYLVYANGKTAIYDSENRPSPENFIGIGVCWGSRALIVDINDIGNEADGYDITLTAGKDKTEYSGYIDNYLEAVADWNGKANTEHLKQIGLNKKIQLKDGQYIPSLGEMYFIYLNRKAINEALEYVGGMPIDGLWYWTSTERSATYAWYLYLNFGHANYIAKATYTGRVRPVSAFIS